MALLKPVLSTVGWAGTTHAQTIWQLFRNEDDACVLDIQSTVALTSFTVPEGVSDEGTPSSGGPISSTPKGAASAWSDYEYFSTQTTETDLNANGIPDAQEVPSTAELGKTECLILSKPPSSRCKWKHDCPDPASASSEPPRC